MYLFAPTAQTLLTFPNYPKALLKVMAKLNAGQERTQMAQETSFNSGLFSLGCPQSPVEQNPALADLQKYSDDFFIQVSCIGSCTLLRVKMEETREYRYSTICPIDGELSRNTHIY